MLTVQKAKMNSRAVPLLLAVHINFIAKLIHGIQLIVYRKTGSVISSPIAWMARMKISAHIDSAFQMILFAPAQKCVFQKKNDVTEFTTAEITQMKRDATEQFVLPDVFFAKVRIDA